MGDLVQRTAGKERATRQRVAPVGQQEHDRGQRQQPRCESQPAHRNQYAETSHTAEHAGRAAPWSTRSAQMTTESPHGYPHCIQNHGACSANELESSSITAAVVGGVLVRAGAASTLRLWISASADGRRGEPRRTPAEA